MTTFWAVLAFAGPTIRAQSQPEYRVNCSEAVSAEPIALSAGIHTLHSVGCLIGPDSTDTDTFDFAAEAGAEVRITVASTSGLGPRVVLSDSNDRIVREASCAAAPCSLIISEIPALSGTYTVEVVSSVGDATGSYVIQLERVDPLYCAPVLSDGAGWPDTLDPRSDGDLFRFEARNLDTVGIEIVSTGSLDPALEIRDPGGMIVRTDSCTGPCTLSVAETLSSDGTFSAWVTDSGADETGDYTITIDCLAGSCLGQTVVDSLVFPVDDEMLAWQAIPDVTASYNVARGDLFAMRAGGEFSAGAATCLSTGVVTTMMSDPETPAAGAGFFYVTQGIASDGFSGGYDSRWGPSQVCARVAPVCDLGVSCSAPIPIPGTPFFDRNSNCGAPSEIGNYNNFDTVGLCNANFYAGPELVYELELGAGNNITATLSPEPSADLGVFFVTDCSDPTSCVSWADSIGPGLVSVVAPGTLAAGTYYVYVDAFYASGPSSCGEYSLEITGTAGPAPELLRFSLD